MDAPTSTNLIKQKQPNTVVNFDNLTTRMDHVVTQNQTQSLAVIYDIGAI